MCLIPGKQIVCVFLEGWEVVFPQESSLSRSALHSEEWGLNTAALRMLQKHNGSLISMLMRLIHLWFLCVADGFPAVFYNAIRGLL